MGRRHGAGRQPAHDLLEARAVDASTRPRAVFAGTTPESLTRSDSTSGEARIFTASRARSIFAEVLVHSRSRRRHQAARPGRLRADRRPRSARALDRRRHCRCPCPSRTASSGQRWRAGPRRWPAAPCSNSVNSSMNMVCELPPSWYQPFLYGIDPGLQDRLDRRIGPMELARCPISLLLRRSETGSPFPTGRTRPRSLPCWPSGSTGHLPAP